jgi:hypothetical protein
MQDSLEHLDPFVKAFDDSNMLGAPARLLLVRRCYEAAGKRYTTWLQQEPDALRHHLQGVREAARFSSDLRDEIALLDGSAKVEVRCH